MVGLCSDLEDHVRRVGDVQTCCLIELIEFSGGTGRAKRGVMAVKEVGACKRPMVWRCGSAESAEISELKVLIHATTAFLSVNDDNATSRELFHLRYCQKEILA